MATKLVRFLADIYPHCKGDVKALEADELKRVAKVAAKRKLNGDAYKEVKASKEVD